LIGTRSRCQSILQLTSPKTSEKDLPSLEKPEKKGKSKEVLYTSIKKVKKQKSNNGSPVVSIKPLPIVEKVQEPVDEEALRKEQRRTRFEQEQKDALERMKKRQTSPPRRQLKDLNLETLEWNDLVIIGTCAELEKPYLRLTTRPDPSTVRPEKILKKTLELLKQKWKKERNYTYACDQFKSLRQDLTVQRIKNEFTVEVYETHSRIAIEKVSAIKSG
jgi:hypothetical protein